MTMTPVCTVDSTWQNQAQNYLLNEQYSNAIALYEQAIEEFPEVRSHYWHLGLLLLLEGQEAEAQTTWLFALSEADQIEESTIELIEILQVEAIRRASIRDYETAWLIRQHLREIASDHIDNLLHIVQLAVEIKQFTPELFEELELIQYIQAEQTVFDPNLALEVIKRILDHFLPSPELLALIKACSTRIAPSEAWRDILIPAVLRIGYELQNYAQAATLLEAVLDIQYDPDLLADLASFYQNQSNYDRGIETAKRRLEQIDLLHEKIFSNHLLIRGLLGAGGYWKEATEAAEYQIELLQSLIDQQPTDIHPSRIRRLFISAYYLVYFSDQPQKWRSLQNQLMEFCQKNIQAEVSEHLKEFRFESRIQARQADPTKLLRIGYLSSCMEFHSVGWLARWLFQHHSHDRFEIYAYFINYKGKSDPVQAVFIENADQIRQIPSSMPPLEIATEIYQDEIDILIDLDSVTLDLTCHVMALKPAPVQATWLGWDASGIPAIDYFIADDYVLPESADTYYSEKIWRMPTTYIAVDGFEVDAPSLSREDLNIPKDAVVFLSAQRGYKRHQETARLQMQIIQQVPNSYFLIKGLAREASIQEFFFHLADEAGVSRDRLRFLKTDPTVPAHRANLAIADVVLDTFPYNGATTTLETLWMGIPIVTRVGEQFAARNSYGMMKNAGIEEGIAWTDAEYVEWGVKLGTDAALRDRIHCKLFRSRQTSPLWNGKQFAAEMEKAYEQMYALKYPTQS